MPAQLQAGCPFSHEQDDVGKRGPGCPTQLRQVSVGKRWDDGRSVYSERRESTCHAQLPLSPLV